MLACKMLGNQSKCALLSPGLGTRHNCRNKVTVFSGKTVVGYCIITTFAVATIELSLLRS